VGQEEPAGDLVMKKKRPARFSVVKAVKRNSRERIGTPPPERVLEDARSRAERRAARHKPPLSKLLSEQSE
jgi:hypothetical protein